MLLIGFFNRKITFYSHFKEKKSNIFEEHRKTEKNDIEILNQKNLNT